MDFRKIKEKTRKDIEKLFAERLLPAIAPEVKARKDILDNRQRLLKDEKTFKAKAEAMKQIITELQASVDSALLSGQTPSPGAFG